MSDPSPPPEHDEPLPAAPTPSSGKVALVALVLVAGLAGLFAVGLVPKLRHQQALREETAASTKPHVSLKKPRKPTLAAEVLLPGSVQALQETMVNARVNGYVKRRHVDIGDRVKEGQVLLDIETPELDQELAQARSVIEEKLAALAQAKSNLALSALNVTRYRTLTPQGLTSQQDLDQREAAAKVDEANVRAAEAAVASARANVHRLADTKAFARVTAPFAGTVTARNVEVGQLVNAGGTGPGLVRVAQINPLRVFVSVPQTYAPMVRIGDEAAVLIRELAGRAVIGKVTRTSGALDPASRSLLVEVQIANDDGALMPGMFAQVKVKATSASPPLLIASSALLVTAEGTKLATVGADNRIHLKRVVVESDYGLDVGIASGIGLDDWVVVNPGERVAEGIEVDRGAPAAVPSGLVGDVQPALDRAGLGADLADPGRAGRAFLPRGAHPAHASSSRILAISPCPRQRRLVPRLEHRTG